MDFTFKRMEDMSNQPPDLHDLLNIEEDPAVDTSKRSSTPVGHTQSNEISTPAKVLMVGEPVMVKTEPQDAADSVTSANDTSGSSTDELPDGINSPSPGTAAAMESLIEHDDYTTGSLKLNEMSNFPVNFTTNTISKIIVKPQTSIMASIRTSQPLSIAGKKFTVKQAAQPVQVVKRDGGGGPIVTKYIVKRNSTSAAAAQKSQVVLAKGNRNIVQSQMKPLNLQSGSIMLSPIKGGFKIPISPMKSPIKVSVFPPKKTNVSEKQQTISIQSAVTQLPLKTQSITINNSTTSVNGIVDPVKNDAGLQKHLAFTTRMDGGVKYQYVQIVSPSNNNQQTTLRSNQGQPITFTSMAQLNGGDIISQPTGSLTLLQPTIQKFQPQQHNITSQRKTQAVKVTIPNQSNQMKPQQRLIMPATSSLHPIRPNLASLAPGSVIPAGNVGYAMVPAKYVEQLTKQLNSQASFVQDNPGQPLQKNTSSKPGGDGKLKKPCNCTKSQCLKLYCECFANGQFCDECNCTNCFNNLKHEAERSKAIRQCLERNPAAFRPKIGRGKDDNRTHQKGCNCKRSGCLKNYCECYEARIPCTSKCKCIGCKNYEESNDRRSLMSLADAAEVRVQQQTAASTKLSNQIGDIRPNTRISSSGERLPYTFFTQEVIEATCTCLLAQAEEAEKTNRPLAIAESMILEEFGRCLMQIIQSAGKAKVMHSQERKIFQ